MRNQEDRGRIDPPEDEGCYEDGCDYMEDSSDDDLDDYMGRIRDGEDDYLGIT